MWVRHSSASTFQFSVTVWETGTERTHYKVKKPVDFLLSTASYAALLISPTRSSEMVLASYTDPPESHCLWRTVTKWQPQHFETLKWKWNKKQGVLWGLSWKAALLLLVSAVSSQAVCQVDTFGLTLSSSDLHQHSHNAMLHWVADSLCIMDECFSETCDKGIHLHACNTFKNHVSQLKAKWEKWPQATII